MAQADTDGRYVSRTEMVGVTAGEAAEPRKVIPNAVNAVGWRIAIFYIGSVLLLVMLLPWTAYSGTESPLVTFLTRLGRPGSPASSAATACPTAGCCSPRASTWSASWSACTR
jgi:L-asparagine transporter-like permease